jgi:hypothetical protein
MACMQAGAHAQQARSHNHTNTQAHTSTHPSTHPPAHPPNHRAGSRQRTLLETRNNNTHNDNDDDNNNNNNNANRCSEIECQAATCQQYLDKGYSPAKIGCEDCLGCQQQNCGWWECTDVVVDPI